jgi:hypothetical protein
MSLYLSVLRGLNIFQISDFQEVIIKSVDGHLQPHILIFERQDLARAFPPDIRLLFRHLFASEQPNTAIYPSDAAKVSKFRFQAVTHCYLSVLNTSFRPS